MTSSSSHLETGYESCLNISWCYTLQANSGQIQKWPPSLKWKIVNVRYLCTGKLQMKNKKKKRKAWFKSGLLD